MTQPQVIKAGLYEAHEAAAALGITKPTLYRWTKRIPLETSVRKGNGRTVWTGAELIKAYYTQQ